MGNNRWISYAAYGILVIGSTLALVLAERPLSSTVVSMALFGFNLAAIIFVAPGVMSFIRSLKEKNETQEEEILLQLQEIKARLSILNASGSPAPSMKSAPADVPLVRPLVTPSSSLFSSSQPAPFSHPQPAATASAGSSPARAPLGNVRNAVNIPASHSTSAKPEGAKPALAALASFENIFSKPAQPHKLAAMGTPTAQPASQAPHIQQMPLFSQTSVSVAPAPMTAAVSAPVRAPSAETLVATSPVALTVKVNVGDDDVLCLRGEGPGLNWQEGQPMTYDGEDRWKWTAEVTSTVTCRVYLNDEISAFGDDIVLQPGQTLEIEPSFPSQS